MQILRNITTGSLFVPDAGEPSPWLADQTEDISTHPVISRQLAALWANDKNGYCSLTEAEFSPADLASASLS